MRAAVAYDGHAEGWSHQDVQQVLEVVSGVATVLDRAGFTTTLVPVRPGVEWLAACAEADVIVNLCEGLGGISEYESAIVGALELTGIPMTGAGARTIAICHDKPLVNAVLATYGVPVPAWTTPDRGIPDAFPLPAFVKPAAEDASVGIDQASVVTRPDALAERVAALSSEYDGVLVQQYIAGREIAVGFLGPDTLPLSEIDFSDLPEGNWPILSYDAKWTTGSDDDRGTQPMCPAEVSGALSDEVVRTARRAWEAVDGSGYGRVDLRVDEHANPWVIEVNPNPDISADAGLARMARAAGLSYDELVLRIVELALGSGTEAVASGNQSLPAGAR